VHCLPRSGSLPLPLRGCPMPHPIFGAQACSTAIKRSSTPECRNTQVMSRTETITYSRWCCTTTLTPFTRLSAAPSYVRRSV
jgi:hypothetical protein